MTFKCDVGHLDMTKAVLYVQQASSMLALAFRKSYDTVCDEKPCLAWCLKSIARQGTRIGIDRSCLQTLGWTYP